jgi:hypothetical protein
LNIALTGNAEGPLLAKLEREGYVVQTETGPKLLSSVFSDFVRRQSLQVPSNGAGSPQEAAGTVELRNVQLVSEILISAMGLASTEQAPIFTDSILKQPQ